MKYETAEKKISARFRCSRTRDNEQRRHHPAEQQGAVALREQRCASKQQPTERKYPSVE